MNEVFVPVSGLDVVAPQVIVVGGLTGTGKSVLAESIVDSMLAAGVHAFLVEERETVGDVVAGDAVAVVVTHASSPVNALARLKQNGFLEGVSVFPSTVVMASRDENGEFSHEVVRVDDGLRAAALV